MPSLNTCLKCKCAFIKTLKLTQLHCYDLNFNGQSMQMAPVFFSTKCSQCSFLLLAQALYSF